MFVISSVRGVVDSWFIISLINMMSDAETFSLGSCLDAINRVKAAAPDDPRLTCNSHDIQVMVTCKHPDEWDTHNIDNGMANLYTFIIPNLPSSSS